MCEGFCELDQTLFGNVEGETLARKRIQFLAQNRLICLLLGPDALLALLIGALIANTLTHSLALPLTLFGITLMFLYGIGLEPLNILRHLLVPSYLTSVAMVSQFFLVGRMPLLQFGPLIVYEEGVVKGLLVGSKILAGASVLILFSKIIRTLPSREGVQQPSLGYSWWELMAARLHLPSTLVEIAVLTYRYLFLLMEEAERIRQAQETRLGHKTSWMSVKSFSTLGGMIIVRSYDRAEKVHEAMMLRGYAASQARTKELAKLDLLGLIVATPLVILLLWAGSSI